MPRVPRYTIDALRELDRQLAYAPQATRMRHMKATESLIDELDFELNYPEDYIVFRITGYRSEGGVSSTLVGRALVRDLSTLVTSLSDGLKLKSSDDRPSLTMPDAARHLGVSEKTIQRYRREGLVCHYLVDDRGRKRLCCHVDRLEAFAARHARRAAKAKAFSRLGDDEVARIVEAARDLHAREGISLNDAARRLAAQHGRAHETIRLLLRRHDDAGDSPIFSMRGPLTDRQIRFIGRAWRFDVPVGRLAERFGKARPTIHRAINQDRAQRLRNLDLTWIHLPTFDRADADEVILTPSVVVSRLIDPAEASHALPLIRWAHEHDPLGDDDEDALLAAYNALKRRAARGLEGLGRHPGSHELDRIETDLRWAGMLNRRLIFQGLPAAILAIERTLGRRLESQPADAMADLLRRAFACAGRAADGVDPSRDQRVARRSAFLMDRDLAAMTAQETRQRADARHIEGSIPLPGLAAEGVSWSRLVDLPRTWVAHVESLESDQHRAVTRRYGLDGQAPFTVDQLSADLQLKRLATLNLVSGARRALRHIATRNAGD